MRANVQFVDELESHVEAAATQAAERNAALTDMFVRTREQWEAWNGQWQEVMNLLEARRRELANHDASATEIVSLVEEKLEQTEGALRAWLDAARELADSLRTN